MAATTKNDRPESPHLPDDYRERLAELEAKDAARKAKQAAYMRGYRARKSAQ